jgi:hypothetical protein
MMKIARFSSAPLERRFGSPAVAVMWPALLSVSLVACGGGGQQSAEEAAGTAERESAAAATTAEIDQCSLLTPEEVAETLGFAVGPTERTERTDTGGRPGCIYTSGPEARWVLYVMVSSLAQASLRSDYYRAQEPEEREQAKSLGIEYTEPEFMDDLGTAGIWREDHKELQAVVPGYRVTITDYTPAEGSTFTRQHARALMEKALARLP